MIRVNERSRILGKVPEHLSAGGVLFFRNAPRYPPFDDYGVSPRG